MEKITPEIDVKTIVLRGNFNPQLYQPAWFAFNNLLHKDVIETAKGLNINSVLTQFSFEEFQVQVTEDRFAVGVESALYSEPLRDLVLGTFMLLHHTPIEMIGINRQVHFHLEKEEQLSKILNHFAPKSEWKDVLDEASFESIVFRGNRKDKYEGFIRVAVTPSPKYKPGLFIDINDHYNLIDRTEKIVTADKALNVLKSAWDASHKMTESIIYSIYSKRT